MNGNGFVSVEGMMLLLIFGAVVYLAWRHPEAGVALVVGVAVVGVAYLLLTGRGGA